MTIKDTLEKFRERWEGVTGLLEDRKKKLNQATIHKEFLDELRRLKEVLDGVERWLSEQKAPEKDVEEMEEMLNQCRVRKAEEVMEKMVMEIFWCLLERKRGEKHLFTAKHEICTMGNIKLLSSLMNFSKYTKHLCLSN